VYQLDDFSLGFKIGLVTCHLLPKWDRVPGHNVHVRLAAPRIAQLDQV
jgi:hypothetical protein